jgi:release factor glutamine methyltransferase
MTSSTARRKETGLTLGTLFRRSRDALRAAGVPTPEIDARWLVAAAANVEPQVVALREKDPVAPFGIAVAEAYVRRRLAGEPTDRILGIREFWGLSFRLAPATLSPRPDTETIVEAGLEILPDRDGSGFILDLGTGSGAILIALLRERKRARGIGVDRSPQAALVARANAIANGVAERACFLAGDWARALSHGFDLIVSNPPYIATDDITRLSPEVRRHDPPLALDGGPDGLRAYRAIMDDARRLLAPAGRLILELGIGQEDDVARIARSAGLTPDGPARRDLGGVPRALVLRARPGDP